jgi:hypothetical protein
MTKKLSAPPKPRPAKPPANADEWVTRTEAHKTAEQGVGEPLVRLTFDIPESLHRRIKITCAKKGIKRMTTELRRILVEHFPEEP